MMNMLAFILSAVKWLIFGIVGVIVLAISMFVIYVRVSDRSALGRARKEIKEFVKSYRIRCTGNNRFVVTVSELQNIFREYDTPIIEKVWRELIDEHIIQLDPNDNEWCIR